MIRLEDVHKSYRVGPVDVDVLKGVTLSVETGSMLAVVGASGCGKSTMMHIMGCLDSPSRGAHYFEGRDVSTLSDSELSAMRNQRIGFVFQQFHLLPRLTAVQNARLPLRYRNIGDHESNEIAREMLTRVGMADRAHHRPNELSGGQQQRVAIARALSGRPGLILADEPTGALDTRVGEEIMELFLELNRQEHITMVIITHDPRIAARCPLQVRMKDGLLHKVRTT